jgi:hypothetical protein
MSTNVVNDLARGRLYFVPNLSQTRAAALLNGPSLPAGLPAVTAQTVGKQSSTVAPKYVRPRRTLTRIDRRTALGKRIDELVGAYSAVLGGPDRLSPIMWLKVRTAAELVAIAERARGEYMRDGTGQLSDICALERKADLAVKQLRIVEVSKPSQQSLAAYLAAIAAERASEGKPAQVAEGPGWGQRREANAPSNEGS